MMWWNISEIVWQEKVSTTNIVVIMEMPAILNNIIQNSFWLDQIPTVPRGGVCIKCPTLYI